MFFTRNLFEILKGCGQHLLSRAYKCVSHQTPHLSWTRLIQRINNICKILLDAGTRFKELFQVGCRRNTHRNLEGCFFFYEFMFYSFNHSTLYKLK